MPTVADGDTDALGVYKDVVEPVTAGDSVAEALTAGEAGPLDEGVGEAVQLDGRGSYWCTLASMKRGAYKSPRRSNVCTPH